MSAEKKIIQAQQSATPQAVSASAIACNEAAIQRLARGQVLDAIRLLQRAIELDPGFLDGHINLAGALFRVGKLDVSIKMFARARALGAGERDDHHNNLGCALLASGRAAEAAQAFCEARRLNPSNAAAHYNLARAALETGDAEQAFVCCRQAVLLDPKEPRFRLGLSHLLLLNGRYAEGWPIYRKWRQDTQQGLHYQQPLPHSAWDGSRLDGRSVLIHGEQGAGDNIQFARYLPLVGRRGGRVVLSCRPPLRRLFESINGVVNLIGEQDPAPECTLQCPLTSLPAIFKTTVETIPSTAYLSANQASRRKWQARLSGDARFRVGVVWAGKRSHESERLRGIPATLLAPLWSVKDTSFYSLQVGGEFKELAADAPVRDLAPDLIDYAETAAVIANLDLTISTCTSVAHLAGALGRPVWVLLGHTADWRWLRDREDSPWYPSARLFRQPRPGDWSSVIGTVRDALEQLVRHRSGRR